MVESLESRHLLAGDSLYLAGSTGQNHELPEDTNADGFLTSLDALVAINAANDVNQATIENRLREQKFVDVNGDGVTTSVDALLVINRVTELDDSSPVLTDILAARRFFSAASKKSAEAEFSSLGSFGSTGSTCSAPTLVASSDVDEYTIFTVSGVAQGLTSIRFEINLPNWGYVDIVGTPGGLDLDSNSGGFGGATSASLPGTSSGTTGGSGGDATPGWTYDAVTGAYSQMLIILDDDPTGTSEDPFTITMMAEGDCGGTAMATGTVHNVPVNMLRPTLSQPEIVEGDSVSLTVPFTDATIDGQVLTVDWGDGSPPSTYEFPHWAPPPPPLVRGHFAFTDWPEPELFTQTLTHHYNDDDPTGTPEDIYHPTVTVTDDDTATDTATVDLLVKNADPQVVIDSLEIIDAVIGTDFDGNPILRNPGQLDESEGFVVHGHVTDRGKNDTIPISTLLVDFTGDGDFTDAGETQPLALAGGSGYWEFHQTVSLVADDGQSGVWDNQTGLNPLEIQAQAQDDDTGFGHGDYVVLANNVAPRIIDAPLVAGDGVHVDFEFDGEGNATSVTLSGAFADPGLLDGHRISVMWGDGVGGDGSMNPIYLLPGVTAFSVTRTVDPSRSTSDFYPVHVFVEDDDLGSDDKHIAETCGCGNCGGSDVPLSGEGEAPATTATNSYSTPCGEVNIKIAVHPLGLSLVGVGGTGIPKSRQISPGDNVLPSPDFGVEIPKPTTDTWTGLAFKLGADASIAFSPTGGPTEANKHCFQFFQDTRVKYGRRVEGIDIVDGSKQFAPDTVGGIPGPYQVQGWKGNSLVLSDSPGFNAKLTTDKVDQPTKEIYVLPNFDPTVASKTAFDTIEPFQTGMAEANETGATFWVEQRFRTKIVKVTSNTTVGTIERGVRYDSSYVEGHIQVTVSLLPVKWTPGDENCTQDCAPQ